MSDEPSRAWRFYVEDMVEFCGRVLEYTEGLSLEGFIANKIVYDATLRNLELIGEAATHVPGEIRQKYSNIPWRMIVATRNQLIHAYLGIDDDTLWSIIQDDVPELAKSLRELISKEKI
ncbi:MAG: DUF86 domain-containing protein [Burkholderiales bacterium]|nr:DUF86 domain-containing protein [Burkholderiales bacterium]